jgi:hypothetical protein
VPESNPDAAAAQPRRGVDPNKVLAKLNVLVGAQAQQIAAMEVVIDELEEDKAALRAELVNLSRGQDGAATEEDPTA